MRKTLRLTAIALGLAAAGAAGAQGYGPGMGGGYGPGMMGGYGPGMMGGGGAGMMRGYGPGMMGGGPLGVLDLKDEQREKIFAIQEAAHSKNWGTMGQLRSEQFRLRNMYYAEKVDAKALGEQQKNVDDLRRQMLQSHVETRSQVEAILTPEQKKQLRQYGPWWMHGEQE